MQTLRQLASAASLSLALAFSANAAPLTVDGGWSTFDFDGVGSQWYDINTLAPISFSFTLTQEALLTVVDGALAGDQFTVFDGLTVLGVSSAPGVDTGFSFGFDFDGALADPNWSRLQLLLQPGTYDINGTALLSAFGGGIGGIQLTSTPPAVVPVPGGLVLMLSGLVFAGAALRRRTQR